MLSGKSEKFERTKYYFIKNPIGYPPIIYVHLKLNVMSVLYNTGVSVIQPQYEKFEF